MSSIDYNREWFAEDLEVGDRAPSLVVEDVQREDFVRYAGASGDFNRIHYDEPYAREQGNPSVFGQGMLTAGYASHMITRWIGLKYLRRFRTRFMERVWPGDTLTVEGEVTGSEPSGSGVRFTLEFSVSNQEQQTVLRGEATVELPSRTDPSSG